MRKIDRIKLVVSVLFRVFLIGAIVFAIIKQNWMNLALSVLTLFLTSIPTLIERRYRIDFPEEFELMILFFIYASLVLGEIYQFYDKFWWWDVMLHTLSGIIFGILGFYLVYIMNREKRIAVSLSPLFIAVFSFCFAIALGAVWEIFEFSIDYFFGFNMQKSGLVDTMWDLIVDTLGALVVSVWAYRYMKKDITLFDRLEKKLLRIID